jgi:hypothetical protein
MNIYDEINGGSIKSNYIRHLIYTKEFDHNEMNKNKQSSHISNGEFVLNDSYLQQNKIMPWTSFVKWYRTNNLVNGVMRSHAEVSRDEAVKEAYHKLIEKMKNKRTYSKRNYKKSVPYLQIVDIKPSDKKNKKFKVILNNNATYDFGSLNSNTYIDHHDPIKKDNYLKRHMANEKEYNNITNLIPSPSLFSYYLNWGNHTNINDNIKELNQLWKSSKKNNNVL